MGCHFQLPASWKVGAFTINMIVGLALSQIIGATLKESVYDAWSEFIIFCTMWVLSFIMINVGYDFTIDKTSLRDYVADYFIAMTAAGFPWLFVALWFFFLIDGLPFAESLLIARFAAPTSAGILFSMLDAAGLKETWLFEKARVLAIFDDLDTIILMIPLKVVLVGFKWELSITIVIMVALLAVAWIFLHRLKLPYSWNWSLLYALIVAVICKMLHYATHSCHCMEPIHIEVLLPAFVIGTIIDTPYAQHELEQQQRLSALRRSGLKRTGAVSSLGRLEAALEELDFDAPSPPELTSIEESPPIPATWARREQAPPTDLASPATSQEELQRNISKTITDAKDSPGRLVTDESYIADLPGPFALPGSLDYLSPDDQPLSQRVPSKNSAGTQLSKCSAGSSQQRGRTASKTSVGSLTRYGVARAEALQKMHQSLMSKLEVEPELEPEPAPEREISSAPSEAHEQQAAWEDFIQTSMSMIFMVLVGLSMPALIGKNAKDQSGGLSALVVVGHVVGVSVLMVIGKMFPVFCYRQDAGLKERFALCLGMCPRGEVGASIIVISLDMGIEGPSIIIAMCALGLNLILSGVFIACVKQLLRGVQHKDIAVNQDATLSTTVEDFLPTS